MATPDKQVAGDAPRSHFKRNLHIFFITISLAAGCMFTFKLFSFLMTMKRGDMEGFAIDPIMIYAFVAMGFVILLSWAYLTGQFRDIEGPKYEMFEKFDEQERQEREMARRAKQS